MFSLKKIARKGLTYGSQNKLVDILQMIYFYDSGLLSVWCQAITRTNDP